MPCLLEESCLFEDLCLLHHLCLLDHFCLLEDLCLLEEFCLLEDLSLLENLFKNKYGARARAGAGPAPIINGTNAGLQSCGTRQRVALAPLDVRGLAREVRKRTMEVKS